MKPFKHSYHLALILVFCLISCTEKELPIAQDSLYPWCIVAYDSVERSPQERILLLKELGFSKYAYDWRDRHLIDTKNELKLAVENDIEVIAVWLWLNAKRDSLHQLSAANEQLINSVGELGLKTTFWFSMSGNFFKDLDHEQSLEYAKNMIAFVHQKASDINCNVALYNHSGWFGDPLNEIALIEALPQFDLSLVYNFHHGRDHMDTFDSLATVMNPYLSAVNLNGMKKNGEKIMPLGKGDREKEMIAILKKKGFKGPWGILGHVENVDVKDILEKNLEGLKTLEKN